jgi:hypothetical protein
MTNPKAAAIAVAIVDFNSPKLTIFFTSLVFLYTTSILMVKSHFLKNFIQISKHFDLGSYSPARQISRKSDTVPIAAMSIDDFSDHPAL